VLKKYFLKEFLMYKEELYLSGNLESMNVSGELDSFDWEFADAFFRQWVSRVQLEGLRTTIKYLAKRLDNAPLAKWMSFKKQFDVMGVKYMQKLFGLKKNERKHEFMALMIAKSSD